MPPLLLNDPLKPAAVTVKLNVVVAVFVPSEPCAVTFVVPVGVELLVLSVRVEVKPLDAPDDGLKDAVTPDGKVLVTVKLTVPAHPELTVIVFEPLFPCETEMLPLLLSEPLKAPEVVFV
jgi:hypothetical protein